MPETVPDQVRERLRGYPASTPLFIGNWIPDNAFGVSGMTI